jgi:subtilisin-like proprotein convertase family protein
MRRVDSEGDSQISRNRKRSHARTSPAQKSTLRRLALDRLEDRTLLATGALASTLPEPVTQAQSEVGNGFVATGTGANSSSPSVAIDPLNPLKMVSVWTTLDTTDAKIDAGNNGGYVTTYVQGAYSIDGGTTWFPMPSEDFGDSTGLLDPDIQQNFSIAPPTGTPQPDFAETDNASVGFDRNENVYILTSTHDAASANGVLDLEKWAFTSDTPAPQTFTVPVYDQLTPDTFGSPSTVNAIYRWQGADSALTPTLAVDSNDPSFTDLSVSPAVTQTDPFSGNVYVAWETNDTAPKNVTENPNTVKLMSSSNGGQDFTYQAYLDYFGSNPHTEGDLFDQPQIAISQGSPTVAGGQVTIVYDNAGPGGGPGAVAPFFDDVVTQASKTGGTDEHFDSPADVPIATGTATSTSTDIPGVTDIPFNVNITDANFQSLEDLTLTLSLQYPTLGNTSAVLIAPDGTTKVTLWDNATDAAGNATNAPALSGANVGASTFGPFIGTTLDDNANRSIFDGNAAAPYTAHFRPLQSLTRDFSGDDALALNGQWILQITSFRTETVASPPKPPTLFGASLDFTSGNSDITNNNTSPVAAVALNSGGHPFTSGIQGIPVFADPSIASDNTLGAHSPFEGRLYIAVTDDNFNDVSGAYTTSTFIELYSSDDGGSDWTYMGIVNDDNGLTDGFSTGGYAIAGSATDYSNPMLASDFDENVVYFGNLEANVRPKIDPEVAVDDQTGTVVVSFLDTRNDAAAVRVATYIAASTDGGTSFAPETYANPIVNSNEGPDPVQSPVIDAITGAQVNLGPIPDNESAGNFARETTLGFGQHQGLAVAGGMIIPVWSSNENEGSQTLSEKQNLFINSAQVTVAAGPRVISSTEGPVGEPGDTVNTDRMADGTPIANTIVITFDRAVDPSTFPADNGVLGSSPLQVFYNNPGGGTPIQLTVLTVTPDSSDTIYTITFGPPVGVTLPGEGVGTYSYTLLPLVKGMIPYQTTLTTNETAQVPFIDTSVSNTGSFGITGNPGILLNSATLLAMVDVFQQGTTNPTTSPDLQIFLTTQDGLHTYTLFSGSTADQTQGVAFSVDNSISIPVSDNEPLDQTYTIQVVDNVIGEQVFLFNNVDADDFDFQVVLNSASADFVSGNFLDQNANAKPGEQPEDDYSVPDGRNSLPLVVPGPHVSSTSVTGVNGTASTPPDNLVNDDSANAINVTFDREMQVASFTPADVLTIVGPAGPINTPQTFPSTGTSKTFPFNGSFQFIPKAGTLTSSILIANTGLTVSNMNVQVDITDPNDASLQLVLKAPDGTLIPLVNNGTANGANFTNTTFSDSPAANGQTSTIPAGAAPYSLTYTPASPLGALAGKALDGTWELLITDSTATGAQGRLNSWSLTATPQIPKGIGTMLNSTLDITSYPDNSFTIAHLAVQLNITSTMDSDLQVYLVAPNGTTVIPLVLNEGGPTGANFTNTIFDDNATIPIASGTAPFSLTYQPAAFALNPARSLNQLIGTSIEGIWTLRISNLTDDGSVSTLNSWSLIATPQITITAVNPTMSSGGIAQATTFSVGFPTQNLSGNYSITLSPNILSVAPDPADPAVGTPLDTNLNAGVDELEGISTGGATSTQNFPATAVPVAIPYAQKLVVGTQPGVLTSQVNVTQNFPIQGDVGTVSGITVNLNIIYYNDPDLSVTLTAPNGPNGEIGKSVTLFMNIGKGANTADFTNTTLSDTVTPPAPITAAGAPFFGTFNPQFPLAAFTTYMDGVTQAFSGGLWTLTITNIGTDPGPIIDAQFPPTLVAWGLNFQKPQTNTGLGEPVADQVTVGFRLFNLAPTNPLADDTWTAVGPAGTTAAANPNNDPLDPGAANGADLGGPVSVVAIDPADPSGNIAYVGAASGGIWKTNDFLTTDAGGPTYVPLTDFGANYSINIGSIAIFDRNNDPNQSILFAGTGDGESTASTVGNSTQGVGILRSMNGGASFALLDSSVNVDANGNPLPINSPLRDHIFVGTTTYKIIVDPTPLPGGGVIVYAALGGPNGGLWRSIDDGDHWTNLSAGVIPLVNGQPAAATDVLLDPVSASPSTGNLDILYAAFEGVGVFISTNRGDDLSEVLGNVGATNLIQNADTVPGTPLTVADASPNGSFGRIVLAKPALTTNAAENTLYQDWLYVSVLNTDGSFKGLYITKDRGENWTLAQIASDPTPAPINAITQALPTNDNTETNIFGVSAGKTITTHNGNSAFSMAIDPLNPNIVYLGGTQDYQTSGLIRVDLTGLYDSTAYVPYSDSSNDGGKLTIDSTGRVNVNPLASEPLYLGDNPSDPSQETGDFYVNLRHDPTNPFNASATLFVADSSAFANTGYGVQWTPIDSLYDSPTDGSSNIHQILSIVDPLTGLTRLIISDDQGVFSGLYTAAGTLDTTGIGTAAAVTGSRNGNLQDEELYYSAAQPSALAAATAGALFYGSGVGMTDARSAANLISTGNLTWTVEGPAYGDVEDAIETNDRGGTGIATDQTGGVSATNPGGSPSVYEYDVPLLGGDTTNFFRVNTNGQTVGLVNNFNAEFPGTNQLADGNGVSQLGNFAVNPINGSQILISTNLGNVYETTNKGVQWLPIGVGTVPAGSPSTVKPDFDGTYAPALAYGAPDPSGPNGVGNLDNLIYVGTIGGHIYITQTGAGPWTNISAGLDGSSIVSIYTNPNRGSHEAYAVTLDGVYYMANSTAAGATWVNITGNLTQLQHDTFGSATSSQDALLGFNGAQLGGFRAIVADYRYAVPDPVLPNVTYPVLYVSGYGGVFRSLDNGQTWTLFPDTAFDSAPVDGGYLPNVDVTSLTLDLGAVNPATGHATQTVGDPEILLASTLGRGDFAITLAPDVFPSTIALDPTQPVTGGSDSGVSNSDRITNVLEPFIDGISEISNFGNLVTITIKDAAGQILGTGTTDAFGHFEHEDPVTHQFLPGIQLIENAGNAPFFTNSTALNDKVIFIQASDTSGAMGNVATFSYTLDTITPNTPGEPALGVLSVTSGGQTITFPYDTGRSSTDNNTNLSIPAQPGPGGALTIVTPAFVIPTPIPTANPLTPFPIGLTLELFRSTSNTFPTGPNTVTISVPLASPATSSTTVSDPGLAALADAPGGINETFYYEAEEVDAAGNVSNASTILTVYVDTIAPAAPTSLKLTSIISNTQPLFTVTGLLTGGTPVVPDQLYLYKSNPLINGGAEVLAGIGNVGATTVFDGENLPAPVPPANADGVYTYQVAQQDVFGNFSPLNTTPVVVTINTQTPPTTPFLSPTAVMIANVSYFYDSGRSQTDNITNFAIPLPTPGVTPNFKQPLFDVNTVAPAVGQPATTSVELLRSTSPTGQFTVVGTTLYAPGTVQLVDTNLTLTTGINTTYYYEAEQTDAAGIVSAPSGIRAIYVETIVPTTLGTPTLDPSTNTGLVPSQDITNNPNPLFDLASGNALGSVTVNGTVYPNQLLLYRSSGNAAPVLVGTAPVGATSVFDGEGVMGGGGVPSDGTYLYSVAQEDIAGNVSALNSNNSVAVTINRSVPTAPTIGLLAADDSGLPLHPNVTNVRSPRIFGTAEFNSPTNFPVTILALPTPNPATGIVVGSTYPAANGTYQVQIATSGAFPNGLPDGIYNLVARTTNLAGTFSYSPLLTITIKANGPQVTPTLSILPADDTGIKGDGITANHDPRFTGTTDKGDTVTLYALVNGQLSAPQATTTSSTVNGSFTFQLPFNLTDGSTTLYAQTTDVAGNKGLLSAPLSIQIITVAGDYTGNGTANIAIFRPNNETYYVQGAGAVPSDPSSTYRDVPVQYDTNGDGTIDYVSYQYDTATYLGLVPPSSSLNFQYGQGGTSLPVSGYYNGATGTFTYANYSAATGVWQINLPRPGGFSVQFGIPGVDIPVPAAYNGGGVSEIAIFRPQVEAGGDADDFFMYTAIGQFSVSFTSPAVEKLGFTYQPGDIPAPADYDGVGHDEFAIYRPSTGQFFILNTPNDFDPSTWTLRTVTMNLPGGPNVNDVPVSEDYDGNGKIDPAVYRPSTSTFYILHSSTGIQQNIQYGVGGLDIAAAGPLTYRLTALQGKYATTAGFTSTGTGGGGRGSAPGAITVHASAISSSTSSSVAVPSLIAVAAPVTVISPTVPTSPVATSAAVSAPTSTLPVTVGASTPKTLVKTVTPSKSAETTKKSHPTKVETAKKPTKPLTVETKTHKVEAKTPTVESKPKAVHPKTTPTVKKPMETLAAVAALQKLVLAKKGKDKS